MERQNELQEGGGRDETYRTTHEDFVEDLISSREQTLHDVKIVGLAVSSYSRSQ